MSRDVAKWGKVVREAKISVDLTLPGFARHSHSMVAGGFDEMS